MNQVQRQIYQNVIDSLCLADNYRTTQYLMPDKHDETTLEEWTHKLVSLLSKKEVKYKEVANVGRFPLQYEL
jgi:hypothetical protein